MMNEKVFQKIYDELDKYLLEGWTKLVAYFEYGVGSYSFSFYEKIGNKYIKCYDLDGVEEDSIDKSFKKIDKILLKERKNDKNCWTNMTMVVSSEGNMHSDFDYTDLSEGNYKYKKQWKEKYLK